MYVLDVIIVATTYHWKVKYKYPNFVFHQTTGNIWSSTMCRTLIETYFPTFSTSNIPIIRSTEKKCRLGHVLPYNLSTDVHINEIRDFPADASLINHSEIWIRLFPGYNSHKPFSNDITIYSCKSTKNYIASFIWNRFIFRIYMAVVHPEKSLP